MNKDTHDKEWVIEDKIISMMALCDDEKHLWGMDTDLGHQDVMRKAIKNELDQIRRDAEEVGHEKGFKLATDWYEKELKNREEGIKEAKKEASAKAKAELLDEMFWIFRSAIHNNHTQIKVVEGIPKSFKQLEDTSCYGCDIIHSIEKEVNKLRAKTLGEQVKKE